MGSVCETPVESHWWSEKDSRRTGTVGHPILGLCGSTIQSPPETPLMPFLPGRWKDTEPNCVVFVLPAGINIAKFVHNLFAFGFPRPTSTKHEKLATHLFHKKSQMKIYSKLRQKEIRMAENKPVPNMQIQLKFEQWTQSCRTLTMLPNCVPHWGLLGL